MKLSQFKFRLPDEKIALYPRTYNPETKYYNRDEAKLIYRLSLNLCLS